MKTYDSLIPYLLMSMHPLMHLTMLISGTVLLTTNYDKFYEIEGTCPKGTEGEYFMVGGKYEFMSYAMAAHAGALILHWLYQLLNHWDIKVLANMCLVSKMALFFILILRIQSGIDFTECATETGKSQVMAWLTYEVMLFYINLISLATFIFIQNFKQFKSIRDRMGLAGNQRKTLDFLNYAKDDVHWWSAWFNQLVLCILALVFRNNAAIDIKLSVIEVFTKHAFGAFLIRQLYFNSKFQFKLNTKVILGLTVLVNLLLIIRYVDLTKKGSKWWAAIVLNDIVLYSVIFLQML